MLDFIVNTIGFVCIVIVALFIYAAYFDPELLKMAHCTFANDNMSYTMCRLVQSRVE